MARMQTTLIYKIKTPAGKTYERSLDVVGDLQAAITKFSETALTGYPQGSEAYVEDVYVFMGIHYKMIVPGVL